MVLANLRSYMYIVILSWIYIKFPFVHDLTLSLSLSLSQTLTNINFIVLLTVWGTASGVFNAILVILPQYLCPYGYSNVSYTILPVPMATVTRQPLEYGHHSLYSVA